MSLITMTASKLNFLHHSCLSGADPVPAMHCVLLAPHQLNQGTRFEANNDGLIQISIVSILFSIKSVVVFH